MPSETEFKKGKKPGPGRPPGTPNKATKEFRDTVTKLLSDNAQNVALWLAKVADGTPEVTDADGKVAVKGVPGAPDKALDLLAKLAEFAAPKLGRTELTGKDGAPIALEDVKRPKLSKAEWLAAHGVGTAAGSAE